MALTVPLHPLVLDMTTDSTYNSKNIQNLGYPDNVRAKPQMYMGEMGSPGIWQCIREIADNCVDECLVGHASTVDIVIDGDTFTIIDDGRGIPSGMTQVTNAGDSKKVKIPTLRAVFGVMHTSGKFNDNAYKVSRGCFTGDTKIRLLDGRTVSFDQLYDRWCKDQTPIEVMSYDRNTRTLRPSVISHVQLTKKTRDLVRVFVGDTSVTCTPDHKFYVNLGGSIQEVQAKDLVPGVSLVSLHPGTDEDLESLAENFNYEVKKVSVIHRNNAVPVYDMTVDDTHVFFVEPGVLVANSHGAGSKGSNALSREFEVTTFHGGQWHKIVFAAGSVVKDAHVIKAAPVHPATGKALRKGTMVRMKPDYTVIGKNAKLSPIELVSWSHVAAYFTPGLKIRAYIRKDEKFAMKEFFAPNGPLDYVNDRVQLLLKQSPDGFSDVVDKVFTSTSPLYDCVLRFTTFDGSDARSFTNGLINIDGGTHSAALIMALKDSLLPFATKKQTFTVNELKDGLIGLINIKMSGPKFSSQTKEKLVDERGTELKPILQEALVAFFKANKKVALAIVDRASRLREMKSRFTASKQTLAALKRISKKGLPAVAATAPKCKPEERECYLLEGQSASGGMRFARLENFQEFLPLRGKPKNLVGAKNRSEEASVEVLNILAMLGVDPRSEDPTGNLRVSKLIVMADADPDGSHIQTLIFSILYKYVPEMFDRGMVYVTRVPEYYSIVGGHIYSGDSLEEVQELLKTHKAKGTVNHVKGYGEIDSKLLRLFACDPATRCLYQVKAKSFDRFEVLMGVDSAPRKQLLGL